MSLSRYPLHEEIAELKGKISQLENQNARLTAEVERLRKEMQPLVDELDQVKDLREQDKYAHSQECGMYEQQLATLTERLAAAEGLLTSPPELYIDGKVNARPAFRKTDSRWVVYWPKNCSLLSEAGETLFFDDWYAAYQAAITAGWLPQDEAKGAK